MTRVVVISPGSKVAEVRRVGKELADWQALVGGDLELLPLSSKVRAFINEEGKYAGLSRNTFGDAYVRAALSRSGRRLMPGDYIVGPVVLFGPPRESGEADDVPEPVLAELREAGMTVREEEPDA